MSSLGRRLAMGGSRYTAAVRGGRRIRWFFFLLLIVVLVGIRRQATTDLFPSVQQQQQSYSFFWPTVLTNSTTTLDTTPSSLPPAGNKTLAEAAAGFEDNFDPSLSARQPQPPTENQTIKRDTLDKSSRSIELTTNSSSREERANESLTTQTPMTTSLSPSQHEANTTSLSNQSRPSNTSTNTSDAKVSLNDSATPQQKTEKTNASQTNSSATQGDSPTPSPGIQHAQNISWNYSSFFHPDGRPIYTVKHPVHSNYFQLAMDGYFNQSSPRLRPLRMLQIYIERHGQARLRQEVDSCLENTDGDNKTLTWQRLNTSSCANLRGRKFVVGRYSCPSEAGNRLHKYMNHLLWAMVTGRTFLSGYWGNEDCINDNYDLGNAVEYCKRYISDDEASCSKILKVNDWVPRFDQWKEILQLEDSVLVDGIRRGNEKTDKDSKWGRPYDQDDAPRVIRVGEQLLLTPGLLLWQTSTRARLLGKKANRVFARRLFNKGHYFVYGMLFESLFTMQLRQYPNLMADPNIYQTWMLHSRHPNGMDGSYVVPEWKCLEQQVQNIQPPCVVYLMSDRQQTLDIMKDTLPKYNCIGIVGEHSSGLSFSKEHGPFAGLGYFQDLALVSNARHGFIAAHMKRRQGKGIRTSSGLPRDIVEFRRQLEATEEPQALHECTHPFTAVDYSSAVRLE